MKTNSHGHSWTKYLVRLDPRQFGHPNRRLRSWRICLHNKLKVWKCDLSLSELADVLLAPLDVKLALDHSCYLTASRADLMTHSVFSDKDLQGWKKVLVGMIIQVLNDMIFFLHFSPTAVWPWGLSRSTWLSFRRSSLTSSCTICRPIPTKGAGWRQRSQPFLASLQAPLCGHMPQQVSCLVVMVLVNSLQSQQETRKQMLCLANSAWPA